MLDVEAFIYQVPTKLYDPKQMHFKSRSKRQKVLRGQEPQEKTTQHRNPGRRCKKMTTYYVTDYTAFHLLINK